MALKTDVIVMDNGNRLVGHSSEVNPRPSLQPRSGITVGMTPLPCRR
jgi:hypothetical protein